MCVCARAPPVYLCVCVCVCVVSASALPLCVIDGRCRNTFVEKRTFIKVHRVSDLKTKQKQKHTNVSNSVKLR